PAGRKEDSSSSLAVLPFIFLSDVEEKESLSLGFADALITTLGNLEDLVVPPTGRSYSIPVEPTPSRLAVRCEFATCCREVFRGWDRNGGFPFNCLIRMRG